MPKKDETLDFRRLLAALPASILVLRPDAPRFSIAGASKALLNVPGTPLDAMVGLGLFEAFPQNPGNDGPALLRASLERVLATGRADRMPLVRYDLDARGQGFEERYWMVVNAPMFDADGRIEYILHRTDDATDFVRMARSGEAQSERAATLEQRLRKAETELLRHSQQIKASNNALAWREAELAAVFNQAPLFQGLIALDGTFLRGNELAFGSTGFSREEQIGRKCWDTGWWSAADDTREFMRKAVARAAAGETTRQHADYFLGNGERRQGDFSISPVRDAVGRVILVYASGRDRTEEHRMQEALSLSERGYRSLVANIAGMVYRVQAEPPWRFEYVSEGVERLSGYPPSHFLESGQTWADIMLPEDVSRVGAELAEQGAQGRPFRVEYRIRRRDGEVRWVEGRVRRVDDAPELFEGTVFDIDERKRAELALAESQEHQHYVMQSVPSVLWTARPDGGIEFISEAGRTYIGAAPQERQEHGWLNYVHPEDLERVRARWEQSLRTGELYEVSFRQRDLQGGYHWLQARANCRRDAEGRIVRWYGITTDVGELVEMQEQLRDSDELARATVQAVPGIVWRAGPDGRLDFLSDACQELLGRSPLEMFGEAWSDLVHPDDAAEYRERWAHSLKTGTRFDSRLRLRDLHGHYRWYQVSAIASRDDKGRVLRWHGLATDIEDLLQARLAAESATRAKSVFLSTMSHEIRTPLNAVLGFAGLLADTELEAQQRDFVNSIRASGDHLLGVINDILDFSKLESGSLSLDFAPCDLRQVIEAALDIVASQAAPKNLELLYRIGAEVPPCFIVDQARIRQVLVNLLSNAVKFTDSGEVRVSVSSRHLGADEEEFEFRVSDTGIGIPAEQIGRLFRDFSQVEDSAARRFGGTGLGLAISKRLVEAHGGTMGVRSEFGIGSTFSFRLPARASGAPIATPAGSMEHLRGRRVLVVDDNRSNLDFLCLQLKAWGMDPVGLQDPRRVLEALRGADAQGERFDLALLDQHMPELDGLELAARVYALTPMPIVLMSSLGTTLHSARATGAHIAAVQTKPVHRASLLETLSTLLAPKPANTEAGAATQDPMPPLRLLLVEDHIVNRKVATLLLRKLGYDGVDVALDGLEAVEAVAQRDYDVVLMDVQMPILDGLDATRRIRSEIDVASQPQIVAMTANAMLEDREACMAAGMDDYIAKPIVPAKLREVLLSAARRRGVRTPELAASERLPSQDADARAHRIAAQVLAGGGEMGALMRGIDWAQSPLGPVYTWPQSLRTALSIVLSQKHPMFLWWGRELIQFYNDAYRPILGSSKHPAAMGQRALECWTDIWDRIEPQVNAAMNRGESSMVERSLLCLFRNGYYEEAYFSYSYSPIRDESGGIGGILVACSENTAEVIDTRRSALLIELDEGLSGRSGAAPGWPRVRPLLAAACSDLPFLLVYRLDRENRGARLVHAIGLQPGDAAAPEYLPIEGEGAACWPLFRCRHEAQPILLEPLANLPALPPWPEAPNRAMLLPLGQNCVMVAGLSARRPFDTAYRSFLHKLAARLSALAQGGES